ncbi:hypothetical protein [Nonomuraea sp. NPDC049784]|uniref:hypothetical protein n=1 Tax=Nonomuraea sp. NPDC049784 TaxID=3154361 RepID=UPI0033C7B4F9
MTDIQAIADRAAIEALRGEFTDPEMMRDSSSHLNYALYHDRYQRTSHGWRFAERVYEVRYLGTTPLTGSAPHVATGVDLKD